MNHSVRKRTAVLAVAGLALTAGSPTRGPGFRAGTLCMPIEQPLFSCPIGGKLVSVCGRGGGAVYRFGAPHRVGLELRGLRFAERDFSGGGESQITLEDKDYQYILYDTIKRTSFGANGRHDPEEKSGLVIRHGATTVSSRTCAGSSQSGISSSAAEYMPGGEFVSH